MTAITREHQQAMRAATVQGARTGVLANRAIRVGGASEWQVAALQKLTRLSGLSAGWDSYGSPPVSDNALSVARTFVSEQRLESIPVSRIIAVSGGGVQLTWEFDGCDVDVEIQPSGAVEVLLTRDDESVDVPAAAITSLLAFLATK